MERGITHAHSRQRSSQKQPPLRSRARLLSSRKRTLLIIVDSFFGRVDTVPVARLSAQQLLGRLPPILNEGLLGDCGFVHSQVEYVLSFLKFRGKSVDANSLRPESGSYLAR